MKNIKFINLSISIVLVLICFSCGVTKEPTYNGEFWKNHSKDWNIQKWHLDKWNDLNSGIGSWSRQKYSLDSLRQKKHTVQDCTVINNIQLIGEFVSNQFENSISPIAAIVEIVKVESSEINSLGDTLTLVISIEENSPSEVVSEKTYNVIVGCYKANARAQKHLDELKEDGCSDAKILISKYGLNRVSIKSFLKKELAQKFANSYRSRRSDVWVFTHSVEKIE